MRFVFFILSPFLTFLYSCFDLQKRSSQIVFVLFFALFGYCHTFEDMRADSYRKYGSFLQYSTMRSMNDIVEDFRDGEIKDVYEEVLFSTVRRVSNNPNIMMMVVGLFGGFFYMLVIKRFLQDRHMHYSLPIIILLLFMLMESNIPLMGGIRNFSAFPLFIYSLIKVLIDNRKWWVVGLLLTPFIHFGYIVAVVAALVIWLVRIPNVVLHYIAIVACVLSIFMDTSSYGTAVEVFVDTVDNEAIAGRISNYGDKYTDIHFNKSLTSRLTRINNQLSALFVALFLVYVRRNHKTLRHTNYEQRIYKVLLFFISVCFALISFSVVGQRYVYIAMVLMYLYMFNLYQQNPTSAVRGFICSMPIVYILHIAWTVYNCYCNVGIDILYKPLPFLL